VCSDMFECVHEDLYMFVCVHEGHRASSSVPLTNAVNSETAMPHIKPISHHVNHLKPITKPLDTPV
jgi:hypothetical protein